MVHPIMLSEKLGLLCISEQHERRQIDIAKHIDRLRSQGITERFFPTKPDTACFQLHIESDTCFIDTNYFVGIDWLVANDLAVYIEPKLNDTTQIDLLGMLLQSLEAPENLEHLGGLFHADYDKPWIAVVDPKKDLLSPILIIQFLKLVQRIVRKGLKKSYYRVTENLNCRIKGRILVGQQIKQNIARNLLTQTVCNYQEYGINSVENQFLKLVLEFTSSYLNGRQHFFSKEQNQQLQHILAYCTPAFEHVDVLKTKHRPIHIPKNVFYKEYEEAVRIGNYILKRFSFNISKTNHIQTSSPPFWIDMSKLFELYVFEKLRAVFPDPDSISYHDKYLGGKETDLLIRADGYKCVIDCKYKPRYKDSSPSLEDKRQLAGYTRLKRVYAELKIPEDQVVRGLIIFSHQDCNDDILKEELFSTKVGEYIQFYKLGIKLPELMA